MQKINRNLPKAALLIFGVIAMIPLAGTSWNTVTGSASNAEAVEAHTENLELKLEVAELKKEMAELKLLVERLGRQEEE